MATRHLKHANVKNVDLPNKRKRVVNHESAQRLSGSPDRKATYLQFPLLYLSYDLPEITERKGCCVLY